MGVQWGIGRLIGEKQRKGELNAAAGHKKALVLQGSGVAHRLTVTRWRAWVTTPSPWNTRASTRTKENA